MSQTITISHSRDVYTIDGVRLFSGARGWTDAPGREVDIYWFSTPEGLAALHARYAAAGGRGNPFGAAFAAGIARGVKPMVHVKYGAYTRYNGQDFNVRMPSTGNLGLIRLPRIQPLVPYQATSMLQAPSATRSRSLPGIGNYVDDSFEDAVSL